MKCAELHYFLGFTILTFCGVLAAPKFRGAAEQGDSIEAELVRHHHATSDKESNKDADDNNTSGDKLKVLPENIENEPVNAEGFEEESIDDDDIYDLTVGDVIYDVLLTLRDHPEIVKQLIASEKEKLSDQITAMNTLAVGDSIGGDLSGYQYSGAQLSAIPQSDEGASGGSRMPALPYGAINHEDKRVGELTNDAFTSDSQSDSEDEARHYKQFINKPNEGGESEEKFNYKQFISESDDTSESSDDSEKSEDTKSKDSDDSSHDEESDMRDAYNDLKLLRFPFDNTWYPKTLPYHFLTRFQPFPQPYIHTKSSESSEAKSESESDDKSTSDDKSATDDSASNEEELRHLMGRLQQQQQQQLQRQQQKTINSDKGNNDM